MNKRRKKELGLSALLAIGASASALSVFAVAFALAVISSLTNDPTSLTGAFSLLALVIAGAVSGFLISRLNGDGGVLVSILSSVISTSVMILAGLIIKKGALPLGAVLNLLVFLAVSIVFSLLGKRRTKKHKRSFR